MATINIAANGKGTDFYLRNFYGQTREYRKGTTRNGAEKHTLALADTQALKKALREIENTSKEKEEDAAIEVSAFIQTYNNLMESTEDIDDPEIKSLRKKIKSLTKKAAADLDNIGVTVSEKGELKVRTNRLKESSYESLMKVFGDESTYKKKITSYQKRLNHAAETYSNKALNQKNLLKASKSFDAYA